MYHSENMLGDSAHFGEFPLYRKVLRVQENGDVVEEFEEMSKEEKLKPQVSCSMADLGNGVRVPDVSYLDKFQAMDLLEEYVDNMDISSIASPVVEPLNSLEDE